MKTLFTLTTALLINSCVTTHYGTVSNVPKVPLDMSCGYNGDLSTSHYAMVSCTLENTSDEWLKVKVAHINLQNGNEFQVSSPEHVNRYLQAFRFEKEKRDHNTELLLAGLILTGSAVAIAGNDVNTTTTGLAVAGGAATAAAVNDLSQQQNVIQHAYGQEHILGGQTEIPAKMFVRKNFLVETNKENVVDSEIKVCLQIPKAECVNVTISK